WQELMRPEVLERGIETQLQTLEDSVEKLAASSTVLRYAVWALNAGNQSGETLEYGKREVLSYCRDFRSERFAGKILTDIIVEITDSEKGIQYVEEAEVRAESLMVSGILCLTIGAWSAASNLLHRAKNREAHEESAFDREVLFFSCVARRLSASAANW